MALVTLTENFTTADGPLNGYNGWSTTSGNLNIVSNQLVDTDSSGLAARKLATPIVNLPISFAYRTVESAEGSTPANARLMWRLVVGGDNATAENTTGFFFTVFQVGDTSTAKVILIRDGVALINNVNTAVVFLDTDTSGPIDFTFTLSATGVWTSTGSQPGSGVSYSIGGTITAPAHVTGGYYAILPQDLSLAPLQQIIDNIVITHNDSLAPISAVNSNFFALM